MAIALPTQPQVECVCDRATVRRLETFPEHEPTIADLRRSGAVEAVTGGVNPAHLGQNGEWHRHREKP